MASSQGKPNIEWNDLRAAAGFREVFRYAKAGRTRAYSLRALSDDSLELWVVSIHHGTVRKSRKLVTFDSCEDVSPFLDDIERELRLGGWSAYRG